MANFFTAFLDFLTMLGDFVMNLVTGIASMIQLIPQAVTVVNYSISYMPNTLLAFAIAGIGICVVFHIIGR